MESFEVVPGIGWNPSGKTGAFPLLRCVIAIEDRGVCMTRLGRRNYGLPLLPREYQSYLESG